MYLFSVLFNSSNSVKSTRTYINQNETAKNKYHCSIVSIHDTILSLPLLSSLMGQNLIYRCLFFDIGFQSKSELYQRYKYENIFYGFKKVDKVSHGTLRNRICNSYPLPMHSLSTL